MPIKNTDDAKKKPAQSASGSVPAGEEQGVPVGGGVDEPTEPAMPLGPMGRLRAWVSGLEKRIEDLEKGK